MKRLKFLLITLFVLFSTNIKVEATVIPSSISFYLQTAKIVALGESILKALSKPTIKSVSKIKNGLSGESQILGQRSLKSISSYPVVESQFLTSLNQGKTFLGFSHYFSNNAFSRESQIFGQYRLKSVYPPDIVAEPSLPSTLKNDLNGGGKNTVKIQSQTDSPNIVGSSITTVKEAPKRPLLSPSIEKIETLNQNFLKERAVTQESSLLRANQVQDNALSKNKYEGRESSKASGKSNSQRVSPNGELRKSLFFKSIIEKINNNKLRREMKRNGVNPDEIDEVNEYIIAHLLLLESRNDALCLI